MARLMRHYGYKVENDSDRVTSLLHGWIQYAIKKHNPIFINFKKMEWNCFNCKNPIMVEYKTSKTTDLLCHKCKETCKPNHVLILKNMFAFKHKVRELIMKNTSEHLI